MPGVGGLSLAGITASTAIGRKVNFLRGCRAFTVQVKLSGTTKAVVRIQGSIDGVGWNSLGSANSSLANGAVATSTSLAVYPMARALLVSRTTSASTAAENVSALISGY